MKTLLLAAAAAMSMAGASTSALAAAKNIARYDADGDGRLSPQERQSRKLSKMMRWDRDGDGRISHVEYQAMLQRAAQNGRNGKDRFARFDLNRDGFVTHDEIADRLSRRMARADGDAGYYAPDQAPMEDGAPQ